MRNAEPPNEEAPSGGDGPGEAKNKPSGRAEFDLEERTARFGEDVIALLKEVPETRVTGRIIEQLVASAGSVGANYAEADDTVTRKDFRHKIGLCRKESRESKLWLRLLAKAHPPLRDKARALWREAKELNLIFSRIFRSCSDE